MTYSISATAGVDAGIIFAKVSASVTAGVSYTRAMDGSWSITVNALAHRYGAAGKAAVYAVSHGTQTNVLGNCSLQKITVNYAEFPENIGFDGIAVDNLTSLPHTQPWPLAP